MSHPLLTAWLAAALTTPAAPPPAPFPVTPAPRTMVVDYGSGPPPAVRCDDGDARPDRPARLPAFTVQGFSPTPATVFTAPQPELAFSVAPDGRVLDLKAEPEPTPFAATGGPQRLFVSPLELEAEVLAWRFPAGAPRSGCRLRLAAQVAPLAEASLASVLAAWAGDHVFGAREEVRGRVVEPGSDCYVRADRAPAPRVLRFPAVDTLPTAPGSRGWTLVRYDVDIRGRPTGVATRASSGDAVLDALGRAAAARSSYAAGEPRRGCWSLYRTRPKLLAAPSSPRLRAEDTPGCPSDPPLSRPPFELAYPPELAARLIEGWAVVEYDVAPWGALGPVRIVRSEPSERFGQAAQAWVSGAHAPASERGYTGCRKPVRFATPTAEGAVSGDTALKPPGAPGPA